MNAVRQTALLNKRELETATPPSASWHADYRDTAYIYIGGLPLDLSEGDIVTIFSQYGNPTHVNLIRDRETGKSKGFGFLKYEDQRSCDLAVDNLGGAEVLGRMLRVDHTRYKRREGEDEETYRVDGREGDEREKDRRDGEVSEEDDRRRQKKPMLKEERELEKMLVIKDGEEEDPMREYLVAEKRKEIEQIRERERKRKDRHGHQDEERKHRHRRGEQNGERKASHKDRDEYRERDHRSHSHRHRRDDGD